MLFAVMDLTFKYAFILGNGGWLYLMTCLEMFKSLHQWISNDYGYQINHLIIIVCGISADVSLHNYLIRKQKNSNGSSLIPWNVSSNQESNWKNNVPINATLIGTIVTTFSFVVGIWIANIFKNDCVVGATYR